jgi:hypothetical protein
MHVDRGDELDKRRSLAGNVGYRLNTDIKLPDPGHPGKERNSRQNSGSGVHRRARSGVHWRHELYVVC